MTFLLLCIGIEYVHIQNTSKSMRRSAFEDRNHLWSSKKRDFGGQPLPSKMMCGGGGFDHKGNLWPGVSSSTNYATVCEKKWVTHIKRMGNVKRWVGGGGCREWEMKRKTRKGGIKRRRSEVRVKAWLYRGRGRKSERERLSWKGT